MTIKFLKPGQVRILVHASGFFRHLNENPEVQPVFRQDGEGMSVGVSLCEGPETFLVRETIYPSDTLDHIATVCMRLLQHLSNLHVKVRASDNLC